MLSSELIENLKTNIPEYRKTGKIKISSLRCALDIAGIKISNEHMNELFESMPNEVDQLDLEDFENVLLTLNSSNHQTYYTRISGDYQDDLKAYCGRDIIGSIHTVSSAEERGYTEWINRSLQNDEDLSNYLPIISDNNSYEDLYNKMKDGVILCKLINKACEDTIDERAINKGQKLKIMFNKQENLNLAINSASSLGCCVINIGSCDILEGTQHLLLGLLWQIIRIGLLSKLNISCNPNLKVLLLPDEDLDNLRKLSPEELLIRWVNHQLAKSGCNKSIKNFKDDLRSSEVYVHLIYQIAPVDQKDKLIKPEEILSIKDSKRRAELVLDNAAILNAKVFVTSDDIINVNDHGKNRDKLNLAFIANLFNTYPTLTKEDEIVVEEEVITYEETMLDMSLEEKTYKNWINSLGLLRSISDIYVNMCDGLVFLRVLDYLNPGCVNWKVVVEKFHPARRLFQQQINCNEVIKAATKCGLKVQLISGENIRKCDKNYVLNLIFQMMRYHAVKMLQEIYGNLPINDNDVLEWMNNRLNGKVHLNSFNDRLIMNSLPILYLIEFIRPDTVDFTNVSQDNYANACYAISLARKIGANIFISPEHVIGLNKKMLMTLFASLMVVDSRGNK